MIRIKLIMLIGIMGIMGMSKVIPLLRLTQHGSTTVTRVPESGKFCPALMCMTKNHKMLEMPQVF
jgi:hypothetical protein